MSATGSSSEDEEGSADEAAGVPSGAGSSGRRRRSRWRRAVAFGLLGGAVLTIVLILAAGVAYRYRSELLNAYLENAVEPFALRVGEIEFEGSRRAVVRDIVLSDPESGDAVVHIDAVTVDSAPRDLVRGRLDRLRIAGGNVTLGDRFFDAIAERRGGEAPEHPEVELAEDENDEPRVFHIGELEIDDVQWRIVRGASPAFEARLSHRGEDVRWGGAAGFAAGPQMTSLTEVRAAFADESGEPALAAASVSARYAIPADGAVTIESLVFDAPTVQLDPNVVAWLRDLLPEPAPDEPAPDGGGGQPARDVGPRDIVVAEAAVADASLLIRGLEENDWLRLPNSRLNGSFSARGVRRTGDGIEVDSIALAASALEFGSLLQASELEVSGSAAPHRIRFDEFRAASLAVNVSPQALAQMKVPDVLRGDADEPSGAAPEIVIDEASVAQLSVGIEGFDNVPDIAAADGAVQLQAVRVADGEIDSTERQILNLGSLEFAVDGRDTTAVARELRLAVVPDALRHRREVEMFHAAQLDIEIGPELSRRLVAQDPEPAEPAPDGPVMAGPPQPPIWEGIVIGSAEVAAGSLHVSESAEAGVPELRANLSVETARSQDTGPLEDAGLTHTLRIRDLRIANPEMVPAEFASVRDITVVANPREVWEERTVERLEVRGADVEVGEAMMNVKRGAPDGDPPPDADPLSGAPASGLPRSTSTGSLTANGAKDEDAAPSVPGFQWKVRSLEVSDSVMALEDVVPGMPRIPFAITARLENLPLSAEGLRASTEPQRVEISNVTIRSRISPDFRVADLNTVFLHFTLAGLLERRLEKVEIVSPVIYVGEHLFWYIDFYRNYGSSPTEPGGPETEAADEDGWDIGVIQAHSGKLLLAPKGYVIPEVPALPFSGTTRLENSQLAFDVDEERLPASEKRPLLELHIPRGDYPLRAFNLDWDVNLIGLEGTIAFNLPIEQRSNNLVQTLKAEQVVFDQVSGDNVFLAVTYDQYGVYAQFGGETYQGYTNGEFNLYIDEVYSFDGWVTGTEIALAPLTETLTPEYLRARGGADVELIASGDFESLASLAATGKFDVRQGGGTMEILALDDVIEKLPEDYSQLQRDLARIGLGAFQSYSFEQAGMTFAVAGREGELHLGLNGPQGGREVNVFVHDLRPAEVADSGAP